MTRTNARQLALQLSFAVSAGSDVGPDAFFDEDYFRALPAEDSLFTEIPGEKERAYINALVTGVRDHREELDDLIEQSDKLIGKPPAMMTKEDKVRAIRFLNDHGALLITKSGDKIANHFGISKYTLYSYLDVKTGGKSND